jgi:hypothetical protein
MPLQSQYGFPKNRSWSWQTFQDYTALRSCPLNQQPGSCQEHDFKEQWTLLKFLNHSNNDTDCTKFFQHRCTVCNTKQLRLWYWIWVTHKIIIQIHWFNGGKLHSTQVHKHTALHVYKHNRKTPSHKQKQAHLESEDQSMQVVSSKEPWKTRSIINGLNSPVWGPGALKTNTVTIKNITHTYGGFWQKCCHSQSFQSGWIISMNFMNYHISHIIRYTYALFPPWKISPKITVHLNTTRSNCYIRGVLNLQKYLANSRVGLITCSVLRGGKYGKFHPR